MPWPSATRTTALGAQTYTVKGDESQATQLDGLPLGTVGGVAVAHVFPLDGEYEFDVGLFRNNLDVIRGLEHPHDIEIAVDGRRVFLGGVGGEHEAGRQGTTINELSDSTDARLTVRVPVEAGPKTVTAAFIRKIGEGTNRLRPFERSNSGTYDGTGRPHVETLTITGPYVAVGSGDTPSRRRIFSCMPAGDVNDEACAREILSSLARRAYRRPVTAEDIERLMPFFDEGRAAGGFEAGIQLALRRILASPSFAFRIEAEPENAATRAGMPAVEQRREQLPSATSFAVSDVELASRLSFFLWSSIPDDELLTLAERNELSEPGTLRAQVRRMLADPKAAALVENFAGQWLHLRNLDNINPNSDEFPDFDNNLRQGFKRETELFFASVMNEDRSLVDLMTADYTFVDERLARHYGIPNVYGSHFRRVELGPELAARRGLLGKGGILMATSHADRTAPTLRGKWLLENLLGSPPPPPPANVPGLETGGRRRADDDPRALGIASGQSGVRELPPGHGSARLRHGELRRRRRVADDRSGPPDRLPRRVHGRQHHRRRRAAARGAVGRSDDLRRHGDAEAADVRPRARPAVLRYAGSPPRSRRGARRQLQVFRHRHRDRGKRTVQDAGQGIRLARRSVREA